MSKDKDLDYDFGFEPRSKIEQNIDTIFAFVEECKTQKFNNTNVIVPKNELYDHLDALRSSIPDDVKKFQRIVANRSELIKDAQKHAATILEDAKEQYSAMVEEQSIVQEAYRQAEVTREEAIRQGEEIIAEATRKAQEILDNARRDEAEIYSGAMAYTDDLLSRTEKMCNEAYALAKENTDNLLEGLKSNIDEIRANRQELSPQENTGDEETSTMEDELLDTSLDQEDQ